MNIHLNLYNMGCGCNKRANNLPLVRNLAIKYVRSSGNDVHIYSYRNKNRTIYNFEPININRKNVVEVIKYDDVKKNINNLY